MDLNKNGLLFPHDVDFARHDNIGDTTLCLNGPGFGGSNISMFGGCKSNAGSNVSFAPDDGCRLVLGLGPTPSTYSNDYLGFSLKTTSKGLSTVEPPRSSDSILQLCLSGGNKEASSVSMSSETEVNTCFVPSQVSPRNGRVLIPVVDEGSTSAKKSGGYMPSLLLAPRMDGGSTISFGSQEFIEFRTKSQLSEPSLSREYSVDTVSEQETAGTNSEQRVNNPKKCKFLGCMKGARGATGLCIGHGGGQRCQKPSCNKGAESRTAYCKAHGGGKRCEHLGCTKSAEGKTEYCIAHGGGRRCGHQGCTKAARGKSGLCIRHGGGKRCKIEGCTRSAEGQAGLCISHGGGRRCQRQGCTKGAQGSTMYCKAHGGGKRCVFQGCNKGAEGSTPLCKGHGGGKRCLFDGGGICPKSVHGGTNFCVAHGGGKRCSVPGCTKSARGRTDCCVKHGGGKRCRQEGCGKSAQGSTDFCKAHGGGKRCCWGGEGKCEKFARGKSGLCAAHSSLMQERESGGKASHGGGLIGPRLFHGLVPAPASTTATTNNSASAITVVSDCIDSGETQPRKRQQLIPPQVLVPLSMKSNSTSTTSFSSLLAAAEKADGRNKFDIGVGGSGGGGSAGRRSFEFNIPEGRVHGGPLMSLFGGNLNNAIDGM